MRENRLQPSSPCSTLIAADTDNEILVWDIICSETKLTLPKTSDWVGNGFWQLAFAFSPDGQYLASGGSPGSQDGVNPRAVYTGL